MHADLLLGLGQYRRLHGRSFEVEQREYLFGVTSDLHDQSVIRSCNLTVGKQGTVLDKYCRERRYQLDNQDLSQKNKSND